MQVKNVRIMVAVAAGVAFLLVALDWVAGRPIGSIGALWVGTVIAGVLVVVALGVHLYADLTIQVDELTATVERLEGSMHEDMDQLKAAFKQALLDGQEAAPANGRSNVTPLGPRKPS